jgi:hypothetical protein
LTSIFLTGFRASGFFGSITFENAVLEAGLDLVGVDGVGNPDGAGERAETPLKNDGVATRDPH